MTVRTLRFWGAVGVVGTLGLGLTACSSPSGSPSGSTTSSSTTPGSTTPGTSADAKAISEAVAAVNLLLDFQAGAPSANQKLAQVENGAAMRAALLRELASMKASLVVGASVSGAQMLDAAECAAAGVSSPCIKVDYSLVTPKGSSSSETALVVRHGGRWVVSSRTACALPQHRGGPTTFAKPAHPAC